MLKDCKLKKDFDLILHNFDVSFLKNKRIAVFGASGLIGKYLLAFLLYLNGKNGLNLSVTAYCRNGNALRVFLKDNLNENSTDIRSVDVTHPFSLGGDFDFVIMAASPADPLSYSRKPVETFLSNVLGMQNLMQSFSRAENNKGPRVLYISSGEVYGINEELPQAGFSEEDYQTINHLNPRSCYSMGKKAAECLGKLYCEEYGADVLIARLCHIYGPTITTTNSRADAQFLRNAASHEDIVMKSAGEQVRSYCYVGDLCSALLQILAKGASGEAYNVANPSSVMRIRDYAETLARVAHVRLAFAIPNDEEKRGYTRVPKAVLNPSKLLNLGWTPIFSIEEGLTRTIEIYKALNSSSS